MKYCMTCGNKLTLNFLEGEGLINYCSSCKKYVFPVFSTAVSTVIFNRAGDKILLVKKLNGEYILLAGYINKKETAENALVREANEEASVKIIKYKYMKSKFYEPSNCLMLNFISVADTETILIKDELERADWFSFDEALNVIKKESLAQEFLIAAIDYYKKNKI